MRYSTYGTNKCQGGQVVSIKGCKGQVRHIKKYIRDIEICVINEEYEDIPNIVSDIKGEVEGLEDELDETVNQAGDIRLSLEVLEG